ncbi:MAG: hypothetical protein KC502_09700 [Myxococcales bacterium]|nr:hypothetical protein [Myxococcales bacterium]
MGLLNGSASYCRFVTLGELPEENMEQSWADALEVNSFREIQPHSEEEISAGWVRFDDAFEGTWAPEELIGSGGVVLLRMRIDTLKIPGVTFKAYLHAAEKKRLVELKREKFTRSEKDQIKLEVKKDLRVQSLPRMQLIEAAWNISSGEMRLFSTSKSVAGAFVELFEKTFTLSLRPVGPITLLWLRGMSDEDIDKLELIDSERFHLASN